MANSDLFSFLTMLNDVRRLGFEDGVEPINEELQANPSPPHGIISTVINSFRCCASDQELEFCLQLTFSLMTNSREVVAQCFEDMISEFDRRDLERMASFLTSHTDYVMPIASNKYGSKRMQKLLGKSNDVDNFFAAAIFCRFVLVMTDKHASHVAIQGVRVFRHYAKESMCKHILLHALELARDQYGCIALNEIITASDDPSCRDKLLDIVLDNALLLSNDDYGNFVVQHVLKLYDFRSMHYIADNIHGQCVDLSFNKYGSYIVERLLEAEGYIMEAVILELLEFKGERLLRLVRSEYGNFVVSTALGMTNDILTADLYMGLVRKLMPFRNLLRRSPGRNICIKSENMINQVTGYYNM